MDNFEKNEFTSLKGKTIQYVYTMLNVMEITFTDNSTLKIYAEGEEETDVNIGWVMNRKYDNKLDGGNDNE
jgi:hypothetical protein